VLLTRLKEPTFVPATEILVKSEGKEPLRVTVYPPAAAPLLGERLDTEESCAGVPPPPPTEGVGVGVAKGSHTGFQEPDTFT
jgi:hypothetical protein